MSALGWALGIAGGLLLYEGVRYVVVRRARHWLRRGAVRFVREHRVELESARFIDRLWMRERLASDPEIEEAILARARESGEAIPLLREKVDHWVEEIAPYFSISAYYRLGAAIARPFVRFCWELVVDEEGFESQSAAVPEGAIRVYVINHRSNSDPLVLAYGLLRQIALSYAVGEWALVWPLHQLFRAFGSFFVRRGEPDPLYHRVLERFVQLLASHGAVTGFFPEGGLSRDGALRRPRTGLLDYIVGLRREHPDREIAFLPVGLAYDRVLEDKVLIRERDGRAPRPRLVQRLLNLGALAFWVPALVGANAVRVATRSHRKFGYAAICFGEPLVLTRDWPGGEGLHTLPDEARSEALRALGEELLYRRIGSVVPATPVAVFAEAWRRPGGRDSAGVQGRIRDVLSELRAAGAPVALGEAFASIQARRASGDATRMPGLDSQVLDLEEAERVKMLAAHLLTRRRVLRLRGGALEEMPGGDEVLAYYANSIRHHLGPDPGVSPH